MSISKVSIGCDNQPFKLISECYLWTCFIKPHKYFKVMDCIQSRRNLKSLTDCWSMTVCDGLFKFLNTQVFQAFTHALILSSTSHFVYISKYFWQRHLKRQKKRSQILMPSLILSTFEYLQVISSKRSCVHFSNKSVTLISSLSELVDIVDTHSRHLKKAVLAAAVLRNLCIEKEKKSR